MLRLLRPTLRSLRTMGYLLWVLFNGGWQTVIWGNVRAGTVSLAGTTRSFRLLVRVGLWLTILLVVMLLFADAWRVASPLLPLAFFTDSLSGVYVPQVFVPVAVGLIALAWAYLVCGGLHAPLGAKLVVLGLLAVFDLGLTLGLIAGSVSAVSLYMSGLGGSLWSAAAVLVHLIVWPALLIFFLVRWRRPPNLGLEFPACLVAVGLLIFSSYLGNWLSHRDLQTETTAAALQLSQTLQLIGVFLIPFLLIAGMEVAELALSLTEGAARRLRATPTLQHGWGRRTWIAGLILFLVVRLVAQWLLPGLRGDELPFSAGALIILAIFGLLFLAVRGRVERDELPIWTVPAAALLLYAVLFLVQLFGFVQVIAGVILINLGRGSAALLKGADAVYGFVADWNEAFVAAVAAATSVALWLRARLRGRGLPAAAVFGWVFAVWLVWWVATRAGQPLGALTFDYGDLAAVATPLLLVAVLVALAAGRLTPSALVYVTAAALLAWLLEFQDLLSDPLSPMAGLLGAEAVIISAGIFLNVMSAGNRFGLNDESVRFPRVARSLLYFGYALLTVTTVNWLAAAHDVSGMALNEQITRNGFTAIGLPLAFWALIVGSEKLLGEA